jgi:hypothetical protein
MKPRTRKTIHSRTRKTTKAGAALLLAASVAMTGGVSVHALSPQGGSSDAAKGGTVAELVGNPFTDIASHWAKASIEQAVQKGYVNGYEDGSFQPNRQVSRAEFTKLLVSALGLTVEEKQADERWDAPYFAAAAQAGITSAAEFNNNVDKPLTRAELARLAMKALGEKNPDAKKWMYLAAQAGIISGSGAGDIGPDQTTTRAESITVIERILAVKGGAKLKADKYAVQAAELYWHKTNIFTVMPEFFVDTRYPTIYDPNNLFIESTDGQYRAVIDAIIAIDLADPNDPNLKLLPPLKNLRWVNNKDDDGVPVEKYKDSYMILIQKHIVKTNKRYGNDLYAIFYGFKSDDFEEFRNGKLTESAPVFEQGKSKIALNLTIFPKKGNHTEEDGFRLTLSPPVNNTNAEDVLYAKPKF